MYYNVTVNPKEATKKNVVHDEINGKKCKDLMMQIGRRGMFRVEVENENWHTISTSPVVNVTEVDGGIEVETAYTNYYFEPIYNKKG